MSKTRTPSEVTLRCRALTKIERLKDKMRKSKVTESLRQQKHEDKIVEMGHDLDEAYKTIKALDGEELTATSVPFQKS